MADARLIFIIIRDLLTVIGTLMGGLGAILVIPRAVKKAEKYGVPGNTSDIFIKQGDICLRELVDTDRDRIVEIARNFSENATIRLYERYQRDRKKTEKYIRSSGLSKTLERFAAFDKQTGSGAAVSDRYNKLKEDIKTFRDDELLCPYGPIQASFQDNAERYIRQAADTRKEKSREEFRLGIEYNKNLVGCFVFDFIKRNIANHQTIGDIGVLLDSSEKIQPKAIYYPAMYLLDQAFPASLDKDTVYIGATLHPYNDIEALFFSSGYGFREAGRTTWPYPGGERKRLVSKYTDFIKKCLSPEPDYAQPVTVRINSITFSGSTKSGGSGQ